MADHGSYDTAFLNPNSDLFRRIADYLSANAEARTLAPPTGERTRMRRAVDKILELQDKGDALSADEVKVLKTNLHTLREAPSYMKGIRSRSGTTQEQSYDFAKLYATYGVPRTKQKPPKSGRVVITKIRVIRHDELWNRYEAARKRIGDDIGQTPEPRALTTGGKVYGRSAVVFTTQSDQGLTPGSGERLPVLDNTLGEVLLMHGTLPDVIKIIADKGFDPGFNKGEKKGNVTRYGALGQGTYFGDSFAKVQTYTGCPICNALKCDCEDQNGEPMDRMLILARCLLGIPTKARTHDSHRKEDTSTIKAGKHSVIGQERGFLKSWTLFGSNEFMIKQADQMYPEFVVYWHRV
ncbi:hypothetical protein DBR42_29995 [Pelomonas sp. HMWF004]|nr:hypothetical protein DBR42_29995 [Pelomonas sp. HMWF004]